MGFPWSLQREHSHPDTWLLAQGCQLLISVPQDVERIQFCCFKDAKFGMICYITMDGSEVLEKGGPGL